MREPFGIYVWLTVVFVGGVVCGFGALRAQTRLASDQLKAPRVSVMTCTATPSCAGIYYVDVITSAGQELRIIGSGSADPDKVKDWSLVP